MNIKAVFLSHNAFEMRPMGCRLQDGKTSTRRCTAATKSLKKKNFLMRFKNTSNANQGMSVKYTLHHFLWLLHIKAT